MKKKVILLIGVILIVGVVSALYCICDYLRLQRVGYIERVRMEKELFDGIEDDNERIKLLEKKVENGKQ